MGHGHPLEGEAVPSVLYRGVQRIAPVVRVRYPLCEEGLVEDGVKVHKLVQAACRPYTFSNQVVITDEVTVDQVFQDVAEMAIVVDFQFLCKLSTCHSLPAAGKGPDDGLVFVRVVEQGFVEPVEFPCQGRLFPEEEHVNVFGKALVPVQHIQVIRDATQDHIGLQNADVGPSEPVQAKVFARLTQRKRE